ncbi:hypothetical protein FLJC2902T_32290 [Flavobacterium limnosediminis JC2902]|uniref:Uncharacterized protein n=1 Tax=Flavobacterium limnosediminis JC2902 TaxID=1341181 RepID=V6SF74_9FLAO|nr:hypothetical protein FLJC2902T_32290 [Flavobacterium limnosediminis JC2902]
MKNQDYEKLNNYLFCSVYFFYQKPRGKIAWKIQNGIRNEI